MEKYSSFRDPGTGIQPFLPPVAALAGSNTSTKLLYPLRLVVGAVRTILVFILALVYAALFGVTSVILFPVPPLRALANRAWTFIFCRAALLCVGFFWIPVELVHRKKGRAPRQKESWSPSSGDVMVSNWSSWIEVLWLAFRFNPQFVLPVCDAPSASQTEEQKPITMTPGGRTGTGSAAVSSPGRAPTPRMPVRGFRTVTLLGMLRSIGKVPPYGYPADAPIHTLEEIRQKARGPLVLFPECTTSNCRGLLRFADVFGGLTVPFKDYNVFIMCVRYDPPTALTPTLSQSIPVFLNPLGHVFSVSTTLTPLQLSIRLLAPSESPSSPTFLTTDVSGSSEAAGDDLTEVCAALVAQTGRMKRMGLGWEDKAAFFDFRARENQKRR